MKKEFDMKERKTIAQGGMFFLLLYVFACYIAIKEHFMPFIFSLLILIVLSVAFYLIMGKYSSAKFIKDKVLASVCSAFMVGGLLIYGWCYMNPKLEDLKAEAAEAEQKYFLLSAGSLNHNKICNAAYKARKLYSQLENEEKVKMFNYILMTDKCL